MPANAGTKIIGRQAFPISALYDLGPGLRRDDRIYEQGGHAVHTTLKPMAVSGWTRNART
jgi:hypothetical protein